MSQVGTYLVQYRKVDMAGNMGNIVTRTVVIVNPTLTDTDGDGNTDSIENA
jgi:hypothetical protein